MYLKILYNVLYPKIYIKTRLFLCFFTKFILGMTQLHVDSSSVDSMGKCLLVRFVLNYLASKLMLFQSFMFWKTDVQGV